MEANEIDQEETTREEHRLKLDTARAQFRMAQRQRNGKAAHFSASEKRLADREVVIKKLTRADSVFNEIGFADLQQIQARVSGEQDRSGALFTQGTSGIHVRTLVAALLVNAQLQAKRESEKLEELREGLAQAEKALAGCAARVEELSANEAA